MPIIERPELNKDSENKFSPCAFCGSFEPKKGSTTEEFPLIYPKFSETGQVIDSSENFVLIPDIAPLTQDHLLLVTNTHISSFANIPQDTHDEARMFVASTVAKMRDLHSKSEVVAFEHGVGTIEGQIVQCGSCGKTDHAHLHILPVQEQQQSISSMLSNEISGNFDLRIKKLPPLPNLDLKEHVGNYPYLYLWSSNNELAYVLIQESLNTQVPSQLIRKLLATQFLGINENERAKWDWRDFIIFYQQSGEQIVAETMRHWLKSD